MWTRKNKQDLSKRKWKRYKSRRHRAKFEQSRKINLSPRRHQKTFLQHKAGKERKKKCCFYKAFVFSTLHMIARHKKFQIVKRIFIWQSLNYLYWHQRFSKEMYKTDVMVVKTFAEEIFPKDMEICQILTTDISCQKK